ncbi:unnamed protein product [Meloidogyne enterolobii]|uniref:Uncharacterized protein n=1 Tax=Meloidogyne enterolobii TaxID=390850 RepID=A0ACB0Z5D1_MELEN
MGAQLIGIVLGFIEGAFFCFVLSANCDVMNKNEQIKRAKEARKALNNGNNKMVVGGVAATLCGHFSLRDCVCVCSHRFVIKQ